MQTRRRQEEAFDHDNGRRHCDNESGRWKLRSSFKELLFASVPANRQEERTTAKKHFKMWHTLHCVVGVVLASCRLLPISLHARRSPATFEAFLLAEPQAERGIDCRSIADFASQRAQGVDCFQ